MSDAGSGNFTKSVGPYPDNTFVKYYVYAEDGVTTASGPDGAPGDFNVFEVDDNPIGASDVIINEIEYDPNGGDNSDHAEWVELYNLTDNVLDLSYFQFSPRSTAFAQVIIPEGTTVSAHGFLIMAGNKDLFLNDYPTTGGYTIDPDKVVDCGWTGSTMQNAGDSPNIRHVNAVGYSGSANAPFDNVPYTAADPWPSGTVNSGLTDELINPTLDNSIGSNWQYSSFDTAPFGTPQANNSSIPAAVEDWSMY